MHAGVRYGLIGANGTGKSMLLRALAHRWIPGVPSDVRVYYVDQAEQQGEPLEVPIIDTVLSADVEQTRLAREVAALEGALATGDPEAVAAALLEERRISARRQLAVRFEFRTAVVGNSCRRTAHPCSTLLAESVVGSVGIFVTTAAMIRWTWQLC